MLTHRLLRILLPCALAAALASLGNVAHAFPDRALHADATLHGGRPLATWMAGNAGPALARADYAKLVRVFDRIAQMGPASQGFERWAPIAREGARAASSKDLEAARRACKDCHDTMRARYRKSLGDRALP